jgi:hypothetical protein
MKFWKYLQNIKIKIFESEYSDYLSWTCNDEIIGFTGMYFYPFRCIFNISAMDLSVSNRNPVMAIKITLTELTKTTHKYTRLKERILNVNRKETL